MKKGMIGKMKDNIFGNLDFGDYGLTCKLKMNFFGKDAEIDLFIQTDEEEIADNQYESYKYLMNNWKDIQKKVVESIINYYQEEERFSYGPEDKIEFNKMWPEINTVDEMVKQIELDGIFIPYSDLIDDMYEGNCVSLTFSHKWGNDIDDNGIGVQLINGEVSEIGYRDIAF